MTDVSMADEISRMSAALAADEATTDAFSLRETLAIACRILGNNGPVSYTHLTLPTTPYV